MNLSSNEALLVLENPFFHRGPVQDRSYFFGRQAETRRTMQMLRSGQCVSVVGPRRIGKTSFLFHLCNSEVQQEYNLGEEYLFVYIDCQSMGDLDKPGFYQWLWQEIKRALAKQGIADSWTEAVSSFGTLREAMIAIQKKGCKLVSLFDEFETLAENPNLDEDLFSDLRSLAPNTIYVTASQDSLYNLTYVDISILSSPFFNIFWEIHLGFLRPEEAEEMVLESLRTVGQEDLFTERDLAFVFEIGGYHPFFLQLACYYLFEQKIENTTLAAENYESVRQNYAEGAEPHFRYIWNNLNVDEHEATRLVNQGKPGQLNDKQQRQLERKCILYDGTFFSSVFAEFVGKQPGYEEDISFEVLHHLDRHRPIKAMDFAARALLTPNQANEVLSDLLNRGLVESLESGYILSKQGEQKAADDKRRA